MELEKIIERLKQFGYSYVEDEDELFLAFEITKVTWYINSRTNLSDIPEGLIPIGIDMVCGNFFKMKKDFGQLTEIEFELITKSIQMGDTNITFADDVTPEQKFDTAINYLLNGHEEDFLRYRKLVW